MTVKVINRIFENSVEEIKLLAQLIKRALFAIELAISKFDFKRVRGMKICPNEGKGREKARAKASPSTGKVAKKVKSITKKRKWSEEED